MSAHSFGKEKRLRKKRDIDALFALSSRISSNGLTLRYAKNGLPCSRIVIAIGRRFGCAVERNRIRRIVREVFRVWAGAPGGCVDIILTQQRVLRDVSGAELAERVRRLLSRIA